MLLSAPRADDPKHVPTIPETVTDDQDAGGGAHAQEEKAILVFRVVGIIQKERMLVEKDRFSLLERNAMLPPVRLRLAGVPDNPELSHTTV